MKPLSTNELRVLKCAAFHNDGWRPFKGVWSVAHRLHKRELLMVAGTSAMAPYVVYVITDAGREAIKAATNAVRVEPKDAPSGQASKDDQ